MLSSQMTMFTRAHNVRKLSTEKKIILQVWLQIIWVVKYQILFKPLRWSTYKKATQVKEIKIKMETAEIPSEKYKLMTNDVPLG